MQPGTDASPTPATGTPPPPPLEAPDSPPPATSPPPAALSSNLRASTPATSFIPRGRAWLALLVLAAGYAALRLDMNHEFEGASWDELLAFTAAKPFGLRVLIPLLAWPLHTLLRMPTTWVFGLFEALATMALVLTTAAALRPFIPARWSHALAVSLFLLLPVPFLLQHRWPIFYPYDTPAMAFTAAGIALLVRGRWALAVALTFVAALNRESAVLLPFAALALFLNRSAPTDMSLPTWPMRQLLPRVLAMFAAFALARGLVSVALRDNPGAPMQFLVDGSPRLLQNLAWLEDPRHWLYLPAYLGLLPLAWLLLHAWMPAPLRRLGWVALAYVGALMWVANIDEPRVYGEAIVLFHLPVAVALARWLRSDPAPV